MPCSVIQIIYTLLAATLYPSLPTMIVEIGEGSITARQNDNKNVKRDIWRYNVAKVVKIRDFTSAA